MPDFVRKTVGDHNNPLDADLNTTRQGDLLVTSDGVYVNMGDHTRELASPSNDSSGLMNYVETFNMAETPITWHDESGQVIAQTPTSSISVNIGTSSSMVKNQQLVTGNGSITFTFKTSVSDLPNYQKITSQVLYPSITGQFGTIPEVIYRRIVYEKLVVDFSDGQGMYQVMAEDVGTYPQRGFVFSLIMIQSPAQADTVSVSSTFSFTLDGGDGDA